MKECKQFLNKKDFDEIYSITMGADFPWYFNPKITFNDDPKQHFQFTHTFYKENSVHSDFFKYLNPILKIIKPSIIIRLKANLLTKTDKIIEHQMHKDTYFNFKHKTAIFYLNNNNGYTKFINNLKIKSEENKFIEFDSDLLHTGSTCTDEQRRVVLNLNYIT